MPLKVKVPPLERPEAVEDPDPVILNSLEISKPREPRKSWGKKN